MEKEEDIIIKNIDYFELNAEKCYYCEEFGKALDFYQSALSQIKSLFTKYPSYTLSETFKNKIQSYEEKIQELKGKSDMENILSEEIYLIKYEKINEEINSIEDINELKKRLIEETKRNSKLVDLIKKKNLELEFLKEDNERFIYMQKMYRREKELFDRDNDKYNNYSYYENRNNKKEKHHCCILGMNFI